MLIGAIRTGLALSDACADVGPSQNTVRTWLKRGRKEAGTGTDYDMFAAAVAQARADASAAEMDRIEFLGHLNAVVRRGSIAAMRLWWQIHGTEPEPPLAPDPFAEFDEQLARNGDGHEGVIDRLARKGHRHD